MDSMISHPIAVVPPLRRHAAALLLLALILFFCSAPLVELLPNGRLLEALLATGLLVAAVAVIGTRRATRMAAVVLALPLVLAFWFQQHRTEGRLFLVFILLFMTFLGFVILHLLHSIRDARRVDSEVLCTGIATYLLLALLWTDAYSLVSHLTPGAFTGVRSPEGRLQGFEALYFSMTTLTTAGFGDISPVSPMARMFAMMEAACGTLYLAVLISRLVSLYRGREEGDSGV